MIFLMQDCASGGRLVGQSERELDREVVKAVQAVRAGHREAYATIVTRFQTFLMTLCAAILPDRQAAGELAQDVLVRAYQRLDTFDVTRPMKPWLATIAYRLVQEQGRQQSREAGRRQTAADLMEPRTEPDPADRLSKEEESAILWRAVHSLPLAQRTAVVLYYRENMAVADVARAMGISPGSVKTHLFRARAQIQLALQDMGFDKGDLA
jgi:RNA polymerase sigma-70 factor, ECF subfamily